MNASHNVRGRRSSSTATGDPWRSTRTTATASAGHLPMRALELLAGVDQLDVAAEAGGVEERLARDPADVDLRRVPGRTADDRAVDRLDAEVAGQVVEGPGGDDHEREG